MGSAEEKPGEHVPRDESEGVLSNLPRTRPQRATARRAAARTAADAGTPPENGAPAAGRGAAKPAAAKPPAARASGAKAGSRPRAKRSATAKAPASAAGPTKASRAKPKVRAAAEEVPRQGFESEGDRLTGPVAPPGMTELLAGVSEAVNEVARAGISAGERVVRDLLGRVPR